MQISLTEGMKKVCKELHRRSNQKNKCKFEFPKERISQEINMKSYENISTERKSVT